MSLSLKECTLSKELHAYMIYLTIKIAKVCFSDEVGGGGYIWFLRYF